MSEECNETRSFSVLQLSQHFSSPQQQQQQQQQQQGMSKLPKVLQQIPKAEEKSGGSSLVRRHSSNAGLRPSIRSSADSGYSAAAVASEDDVFQQQTNQDINKALPVINEKQRKNSNHQEPQQGKQLNGTDHSHQHVIEQQVAVKEEKSITQTKQQEAPVTQQKVSSLGPELCIGLEAIQEQVRRRALRKGFTLNLMVIGRSGLGKTTLINTLFRTSIMQKPVHNGVCDEKPSKTAEIRSTKRVIEEKGVKLRLSVTDTPGFGDLIDNSNCWEPALRHVEEQYSNYLRAEKATDRSRDIEDTRIHCCLYFIPPTGHGLRPLDIEVLKRLHTITNVIPVLAKADTLTLEERSEFKKVIQEDLRKNGIEVYPLKRYEDPDDAQTNQIIRKLTPFAVAGSERIYEVNGRKVLGRKHLWGIVEVENPNHCEFSHLRNLLIRTHMQDLVELTSVIHYEAFRRARLNESFTVFDVSTLSALNESQI